jgi:alkanesulfonate monooxygenase SsuD/methylene tetrahydromethanopterin reductase-like flavin-dependent oxidoreductase (luciferase family)
MHGFNTMKYTNEVIFPAIREGAAKAGRKFEDIDIVGGAFVITGKNEEEVEKAKAPVRQQLSFYASTRAYHPVLEVHGWQDAGQQLFRLSMEGKWGEMANMMTDEMLEEMAIIGTYDQIADKLKSRYARRGHHARLRLRRPHRRAAGSPREHRPGTQEGLAKPTVPNPVRAESIEASTEHQRRLSSLKSERAHADKVSVCR